MHLFGYVKKYGNYTYLEKEFNEIDNVIFSCLSYVNFKSIVPASFGKIRLEEVARIYFSKNSKKKNKSNISEVRNGIKLLYEVWHTKRFKDVKLFHYSYIGDFNCQFCAVSFEYLKNQVYVSFEGTDDLLSGWEEDFKIAYQYPVIAQKYATHYLNRYYLFSKCSLILGGHSKGGGLAIVAGMEASFLVSNKIIKIYSNDGLGLRKEEFLSKKYQKISSKIIEIIPDYSIVGLLLCHKKDCYVIKSKSKGFFAHNPRTWLIDDNHFEVSKLSKFSIVFDQGISKWLEEYTTEEKERFALSIFDLARKYEIYSLLDLKRKKTKLLKLLLASKTIDSTTKDMAQNLVKILISCNKEYDAF